MTEWFEQWFGEEYLRLYPHRDEEEAAQVVALIERRIPFAGRRVLDLACGPGRHAAELAARGARVVGFDLSMPLLSRARHREGHPLMLVRGDMRLLPFRAESFDLVVNLFTSFGYFGDDAEHELVVNETARVLSTGGHFVLDYLNASAVRHALVPREVREVGSRQVAIERKISKDGRFVIKEIHLVDDGRSFMERVRLFSLDELTSMIEGGGFEIRQRLGSYDGDPLSDDSPRTILFAEHQ